MLSKKALLLILSLSTAVSDKVDDLDFKFQLILVTKIKAELKLT